MRRRFGRVRPGSVRSSLAASLVALHFASTGASAFEVLGPTWRSGTASYRVNPNFPSVRAGTEDQQLDIMRCSADAWRDQSGADFRFTYAGRSTRTGLRDDGVNNVSWVDDDGGDALAVTLLFGTSTRIVEFDVVFFARTNGDANLWNGPQDPTPGTIDIAGVAIHEFGHALGLDHTPTSAATMFAAVSGSGTHLRTLHPDDLNGVRFLYDEVLGFSIGPTILSLDPVIGPAAGGNEVLVRGTNFTWTADTDLRIGGAIVSRARYEVESGCTIRISDMPPGAGAVDLEISNDIGDVTEPDAYTYSMFEPTIASISPDTGVRGGGTLVTITGANFLPGTLAFIGDALLEDLQIVDPTSIIGRTPASSRLGAVDVRVTREDRSFTLTDGFTYVGLALGVDSSPAVPGETGVKVGVVATTNIPLRGVSFVLSYDAEILTVSDIAVDGTAAEGAAFASPNIDNGAGVATFGIVMDFFEETPNIPPGADREIARVTLDVSDDAALDTVTPLSLEAEGGAPPVETLFTPIDSALGLKPTLSDGQIVVTPGRPFIRGDANLDEQVDIADPTSLLGVLFLGTEESTCQDASDSNDDGKLDVSDAVFTLTFLFNGGEDPPAPYPDAGGDPTADDLDCI